VTPGISGIGERGFRMNYIAPFKKTFSITRRYKYLWILGFFTALLHSGNILFTPRDGRIVLRLFTVVFTPSSLFLAACLFALGVVSVLSIGAVMQAGLIRAVYRSGTDSPLSLSLSWSDGLTFWGRTAGFVCMKSVMIFSILYAVSVLPRAILIDNTAVRIVFSFFTCVAAILLLLILLAVFFASTYGMRILVVEQNTIVNAFRSGLAFFLSHIRESLVSGLFYLLIAVAAAAVCALVLGVYILCSVVCSIVDVTLGLTAALLLPALVVIPALVIFWGIFGSLRDTFWTLTFIELRENAHAPERHT